MGLTDTGARYESQERARGVTPFEEQCEALLQLVEEGKIRHWGLSNENAHGLAAFRHAARSIGLPPPACMQNPYSLLQRRDEIDLVPSLLEDDAEAPCSYVPYSPLAAGVLSGKYAARGSKVPKRSRLSLFKGYDDKFKATLVRHPQTRAAMRPPTLPPLALPPTP